MSVLSYVALGFISLIMVINIIVFALTGETDQEKAVGNGLAITNGVGICFAIATFVIMRTLGGIHIGVAAWVFYPVLLVLLVSGIAMPVIHPPDKSSLGYGMMATNAVALLIGIIMCLKTNKNNEKEEEEEEESNSGATIYNFNLNDPKKSAPKKKNKKT
jgi:hypothetical protein